MATETETNVIRTRHLDATRMSRGVTQEKSIDITQVRNLDMTANPAALGLTAVELKTCSRSQATEWRQRGGVGVSKPPAVSEAAVVRVGALTKEMRQRSWNDHDFSRQLSFLLAMHPSGSENRRDAQTQQNGGRTE
ncbi:MAG: hypothetical protein ACXV4C_08310 [Halobacteriota archaeon]